MMGDVRAFTRDWPQVTIKIETSANLDLGNVARLFERLNTGVRRGYDGTAPRVEIVSLQTGSIELRIAALSAALSAAQLAVQISDHLQNDPAATRACSNVFVGDNATRIVITGGGRRATVTPDDIDENLDYGIASRVAAGPRVAGPPHAIASMVNGIFEGTIERISGEYYVQLLDRPGLFLRIRDERKSADLLLEHQRYRLVGQAYFAPPGKTSAFVLESAMQL